VRRVDAARHRERAVCERRAIGEVARHRGRLEVGEAARVGAADRLGDELVEATRLGVAGDGLVVDLEAHDDLVAAKGLGHVHRGLGEARAQRGARRVVPEERRERGEHLRRGPSRAEVLERTFEEHRRWRRDRPQRRAVLADLLRVRVLVPVDEHVDPVRAAHVEHLAQARDVALLEGTRRLVARLERAPVDREAEEVEAEGAHATRVLVGEVGDLLERRAAVVEGHVEEPFHARVHAPEHHDASGVVDQELTARPQGREACERLARAVRDLPWCHRPGVERGRVVGRAGVERARARVRGHGITTAAGPTHAGQSEQTCHRGERTSHARDHSRPAAITRSRAVELSQGRVRLAQLGRREVAG
jgi:hypothetical protein